jgi:hypothetical protein
MTATGFHTGQVHSDRGLLHKTHTARRVRRAPLDEENNT